MQNTLKKYGINEIWHFTDKKNIQSINTHGLLSLTESRVKLGTIPAPGGNQWSHEADHIKGVDQYVHLAFLKDHPMLFIAKQDGRVANPVWLKISTETLAHPNIRYTLDVSNKAGVQLLTAQEAINHLDFEVLFTRTDWKDPKIKERRRVALKSEILIPNYVPLNMILERQNG
jgi:hypothetical protein